MQSSSRLVKRLKREGVDRESQSVRNGLLVFMRFFCFEYSEKYSQLRTLLKVVITKDISHMCADAHGI